MKFARYLEDTQITEWRRAYIDYHALKKQISAIRKANEASGAQGHTLRAFSIGRSSAGQPSPGPFSASRRGYEPISHPPPDEPEHGSSSALDHIPSRHVEFSPTITTGRSSAVHRSATSPRLRIDTSEMGTNSELPPAIERVESPSNDAATPNAEQNRVVTSGMFGGPLSTAPSHIDSAHHTTESTPAPFVISPATGAPRSAGSRIHGFSFSGIRRRMTAGSRTMDKFYLEREQDARLKVAALKEQFQELRDHELRDAQKGLWPGFFHFLGSLSSSNLPDASEKNGTPQRQINAGARPGMHSSAHSSTYSGLTLAQDPDAYKTAKRKLKKAVLEFYRGLELLQNYRILNLTGFRKALKKFEKTTKIPSQSLYMRDRVETRSFAFGETCDQLLKEIERVYAARFEKGNEKKARTRLRAAPRQVTHHYSTFRSGMLLGAAVPALAKGIYYVFQEERRETIPEWAALLQVYAALSIPIIFALMLSLNMVAWASARINFIFIFQLDARDVIDAREYIELPSLLFTALVYAFWLSFSTTGDQHVASTTWPIAWVGFAVVVLANPLPMFHRSVRYWLLAVVGKLFISGFTRVEFQDFWMGDQFCSLTYTMQNMYFLFCAYTDHWHRIEERCQLGVHWGIPFVLTALPSLIRLAQCIRRFVDSKSYLHLVNGGKYLVSIAGYATYFAWRHDVDSRGLIFILWIVFATISSCYATYWDLAMDWSVLQVKGVQYKFLRKELVCNNQIYAYYLAIVANIIIRFDWVGYIPRGGLPLSIRAFIFAILEMFRRVIWNFFRLENEQIGNADQFRVTREIPLPYVFAPERESDDEEDRERRPRRTLSLRRQAAPKNDREKLVGGNQV